jgi:hypothetical protein
VNLTDSLAGKVARGIVLALLLIVVVLLLTHKIWFDNPSDVIGRRMDILGQLVVGIGTAALAVVTWASVYETQQVVAGEDLRFRQSRMPMVSLSELPQIIDQQDTGFNLKVQNRGDGPAQDVQLTFDAKVTYHWQAQRVYVEGGQKYSDPPVPLSVGEAHTFDSVRVAVFVPSPQRQRHDVYPVYTP